MLFLQFAWIASLFGVLSFLVADGGAAAFLLAFTAWALLKWAGVFRVSPTDQPDAGA
jgi:hypothetical protein